jgi:hypothetical protein
LSAAAVSWGVAKTVHTRFKALDAKREGVLDWLA